jgi:hypothetical protein
MNHPRRWTDEGGGATARERELIGAGRDVAPSREQKQKLWGAIAGQAAPSPAGQGTAPAAGKAAASIGLTWLKGTAIVVLLGGGIVISYRALIRPVTAPAPTASSPTIPQSSASAPNQPPPNAPPAAAGALSPMVPRTAKAAHPPVRPSAAVADEVAKQVAKQVAKNARASHLREESAMILDARSALRAGDPSRALTLLDGARGRFPDGILVQEREALAIEALARSGARALAAKRAESFLRDYPKSPHAADVRSSVTDP